MMIKVTRNTFGSLHMFVRWSEKRGLDKQGHVTMSNMDPSSILDFRRWFVPKLALAPRLASWASLTRLAPLASLTPLTSLPT